MELHGPQRQFIDHSARIQHHLTALSRQAENEMSSHVDSSLSGHVYCLSGRLEIMTSVDSREGGIIARLDAVLHYHNRSSATFLTRK